MIEPKLLLLSVELRAQLDDVNSLEGGPTLRQNGFTLFAAFVLGLFARTPALTGIKLVGVVRPEVDNTRDTSVVLRHHFSLQCQGAPGAAGDRDEVDALLMDMLPWKKMANGVFDLSREDPLVQDYLATNDEAALKLLLTQVAWQIDAGFGYVNVIPDFGMASC